MSSPKTEIYFFHIAKTAGSSLASLIRNAYPKEEAIPVYECKDLVSLTLEQINSYRCYTGHFGTGLYSLVNREIPTVTLLRDPFEQTVSHIRHAERATQVGSAESFLTHVYSHLKQMLHFPSDLYYRDFQTRNLGLELDLNTQFSKNHQSEFINLLNEAEQGQNMDEILERAKRRLDNMAVVGTVERFTESVGLICDLIGIPTPPAPPEENIAPGRTAHSRYRDSGEISKSLTALVETNTHYDQKLYAYANQLLDQKLAQKNTNRTIAGV